MTKLEEDIREAILSNIYKETADEMTDVEKEGIARAAAEVAKRYIEKAYDAGLGKQHLYQGQRKTKEQWLTENGIL